MLAACTMRSRSVSISNNFENSYFSRAFYIRLLHTALLKNC
jgi:hypothetical protein